MPTSQEFTGVLRLWAEVFMRRSMHDFYQFSRANGLSMTQISTLFRLYHQSYCGVSDLSDHLGVTSAAASQMIDRLVQQGLLARNENVADRRVREITLTPRGEQLVRESIEARSLWIEDLTTELSAEDQQAIIHTLTMLTQAAIQLEPQDSETFHTAAERI
jgi:DNA-binding MarR family transcriptional regulator